MSQGPRSYSTELLEICFPGPSFLFKGDDKQIQAHRSYSTEMLKKIPGPSFLFNKDARNFHTPRSRVKKIRGP